MRIGINGRFLVAKRTGVQRAAYNLLRTLVEIDRSNEYLIFTGTEQLHNKDWDHENVKVVASKLIPYESFKNHFWEQFILPRMARRYGVDLLHSPANVAPLFYTGKSVVHIHDLCFIVNPQWYSFSFRTLYNLIIPRLARRSTKIITNSNNSRNDIIQYFNLPADKVSLVYWAVDDMFTLPLPHKVEGEDYILYVGSLEPRKNIHILVEAFQDIREKYPHLKTKLVLIGGESPLFAEVRLNLKKEHEKDVIFKGFVNDQTLKEYYAKARVVAYPSLYEGFGLPPLEAMACGTPVVTSMVSSIPEVVGDAAIMVNPNDRNQLASAIAKVLLDDQLRQHLIRKGYERVKHFNWYRVARRTLAIYHEVVYGDSRGVHDCFLPVNSWLKYWHLEQDKIKNSFTPVTTTTRLP